MSPVPDENEQEHTRRFLTRLFLGLALMSVVFGGIFAALDATRAVVFAAVSFVAHLALFVYFRFFWRVSNGR